MKYQTKLQLPNQKFANLKFENFYFYFAFCDFFFVLVSIDACQVRSL